MSSTNTFVAISQLLLALATLLGVIFGFVQSLRTGTKVDRMATGVDLHTEQLDQLKIATNGLTEHLANASKAAGTEAGINQGIATERARAEQTAKDLLNNPLKKESI